MNCEVKEAKKAVKEAKEAYNEFLRKWNKIMCSIYYANYLPAEVHKELVEDLIKKLPKIISKEKLGYEIVCATDVRCIAAKLYRKQRSA